MKENRLPHDIAVLEKTLVDEARAKFGADAIPQNARLATLVHGPTMKAFNQAAEAAGWSRRPRPWAWGTSPSVTSGASSPAIRT